MLASDRSATERWGAAQQFGARASKLGLRQLYLGYLKNTALLCNNCRIVSKALREFEKKNGSWIITLQMVILDIKEVSKNIVKNTHAMHNDVLVIKYNY